MIVKITKGPLSDVEARPRLLDLFCGAGGAAVGYHQADFEVTGVDHKPQPRFPFTFIQADALETLRSIGDRFDAIHASPPCQRYANVTAWRGRPEDYPDLIPSVRRLLAQTGHPWVIENVPGSPLSFDATLFGDHGILLCGSMLGLPVRRHRLFETNFPVSPAGTCKHQTSDFAFDHGGKQAESTYRDAMGCGWMLVSESREAIPPAYTHYIGNQLAALLESRRSDSPTPPLPAGRS